MKIRFFCVFVISAVLLIPYLAGCGSGESSGDIPEPNLKAEENAPERFALRNIYGTKHRWSQFVGTPFVINFWATWCGPCRAEMPVLKKLYAEYQPKGLEIIAISVDDQRTINQVVPFIDRYQVPWIVLLTDNQVEREFKLGTSVPVTLFFDAEGRETGRLVGAQPEAAFRIELQKLFPPSG
jgi:thiol-disulfide isomerase/thioredoxin